MFVNDYQNDKRSHSQILEVVRLEKELHYYIVQSSKIYIIVQTFYGKRDLHEGPFLGRGSEGVHVGNKLVPRGLSQDGSLDIRSNTHSVDKCVHLGDSRRNGVALELGGLDASEKSSLEVPREVLLDGKRLVDVDEVLVDTLSNGRVVRHAVADGLDNVLGARQDVVGEELAAVSVLLGDGARLFEDTLLICG